MNKVLLLNSFGFFPSFPSVSTAKVASLLRNENISVKNFDLNLAMWKTMLSRDNLSLCNFRKEVIKHTEIPFPLSVNEKNHSILKENVLNNIETALNVFKSPEEFYNHSTLTWAVNILFQAQQLIYFQYGCFITNKVIFWPQIGFNVNNIEIIYNLSIDAELNPFISLYNKTLEPLLNAYKPNIIGIDIAFPWEILPVLTINKLIKKSFPSIHINFTGHGFDEMNFSRISHRLNNNPKLFFDFDSLFLSRNDRDLQLFYSHDPNSIHDVSTFNSLAIKNGDNICVSKNIVESLNEQSLFPDYHDLPLKEYYTPHLVLIDKMSNKCFWSKCAFCNINTYKKDITKIEPQKFVDRLIQYHSEYKANHFFLLDEAIDPEYVSSLCDILLERNTNFIWSIRTRIDSGFSSSLLRKMCDSGCREMWIGMENASPKLLKLMNKCHDPDLYVNQIESIVKDCNNIGIGLHFCLLFGFPQETEYDRMLNYRFFKKIKRHLKRMPFFITFNIFNLNFGSDVFKNPNKYNVIEIDYNENNFNMINIPYKTNNGNDLSNSEYIKNIDKLAADLTTIFVPSKINQLLWFIMGDSPWELLYKEHYAKVGENPYQSGGGIIESVLIYLYLILEKYPPALRLFNFISNKKYILTKAQVYR